MSHEIKHLDFDEVNKYKEKLLADFKSGEPLRPYVDNWDIKFHPRYEPCFKNGWDFKNMTEGRIYPDPIELMIELEWLKDFFKDDDEDDEYQFLGYLILTGTLIQNQPDGSQIAKPIKTSTINFIERLGKRNVKYADRRWPREGETFCVYTHNDQKYYIQAERRTQSSD